MIKYSKLLFVLFTLLMISCQPQVKPIAYKFERIPLNSSIKPSAKIDSIISPFKEQIEAETKRIIGYNAKVLKKGKPESLLTNFASDLLLANAQSMAKKQGLKKVDIAFVNHGGLRSSISEGDVTVGDIYKLMPFENKVTLLGFDGTVLMEFLEKTAKEGGEGLAGITFGIKEGQPINIKVNNETFNINKKYYMATSDYLANGGGGDMMKKAFYRYDDPMLYRDMIISHIENLTKENQPIAPQLDNRIYEIK